MTDHLIVRAGTVVNIVYGMDRPGNYRPESDEWVPRTGATAEVGMGWLLQDGTFAEPAPEPTPALSVDEALSRITALETELVALRAMLPAQA